MRRRDVLEDIHRQPEVEALNLSKKIPHNFRTLMQRVRDSGFSLEDTYEKIIDDPMEGDGVDLQEVEERVARHFKVSLATVRDPEASLHRRGASKSKLSLKNLTTGYW